MTQDQSKTSGYSADSGTGSLVTEQVKQTGQQAVQQTQQVAGQVTESAKKNAVSYADSQKQTAKQYLQSVADALHETGQSLQSKNQTPIANYANKAADQVEGFAGYLERTPVQDMVRDAEDFARQHSTLFLGGALALGLAAARFIKASAPSSRYAGSGTYEMGKYAPSNDANGSYGYRQNQLGSGTSYSSGAPYGDSGPAGTPSPIQPTSTSGLADEVELPDATVFNADLGTETTDGTAR